VTVRLPATGEYGLEIYASEPVRDGDTYSHIGQYLIIFADSAVGGLRDEAFDRSALESSAKDSLPPVTGDQQLSASSASLPENSTAAKDLQLQDRKDDIPTASNRQKSPVRLSIFFENIFTAFKFKKT